MVSPETIKNYQATIGIECHVQLKTNTKLFAAVGNDAREAPPNSLISHICLALPGSLPVLNSEAITLAARAAFALGTKPQPFSKFDRKHYFYPDLPKGYQITQYDQPIILGGKVTIFVDGKTKEIGVTRAHLEEDAGKSTHPQGADYSLVDLNRAGTPLLEIVSEPDIHTSAEAKAYVKELYLLMRFADVSDADLYHGNMRFDVNVSVSRESGKLGTRTETKNLNSFKSVEKAVDYEIARQVEMLEKGQKVVQETRGWDEAKQKTVSQRGKEEAHDYRYFPEPDIPPVVIDEATSAKLEASLPVLPQTWRERLHHLGLDDSYVETLLLAEAEEVTVSYLPLIESVLDDPKYATQLAHWLVNIELPLRRSDSQIIQLKDVEREELYANTYQLFKGKEISSTSAKSLLIEMLSHSSLLADLKEYAAQQGYIQESDEAAILAIVDKVLSDNPKAAGDVKEGQAKAIGFLVGQVMKQSLGKANPQVAQTLIKRKLGL